MQTHPMGVAEHRETALEFLREADDSFRLGDDLQGAEKMWGAAAHAVIAVCQQRDWRHRSHRAMSEAVTRLNGELRDSGDELNANILESGFVIASNCHIHFYYRDMDGNGGGGWFFDTAKKSVERFVDSMVAISEALDAQ